MKAKIPRFNPGTTRAVPARGPALWWQWNDLPEFTASGYGQAEQTMEQTEKWLNNYARNEIRFIGADFGERNRHILVQRLPC